VAAGLACLAGSRDATIRAFRQARGQDAAPDSLYVLVAGASVMHA